MKRRPQPNVELLFLPAYSSNLNLIERLWKLVKGVFTQSLSSRLFASFKTAINGCLDQLASHSKEKLHSLASPNFQFFAIPKTSWREYITRYKLASHQSFEDMEQL